MSEKTQHSMTDADAINITRIFDAPRELVWKAWTDPEMIKHWWGPNGFSVPSIQVDLRVGGKYLFCMHGPEGSPMDMDMYNCGIFKEIIPLEKIVCTQCMSDQDGNIISPSDMGMEGMPDETLITVTFEEMSDGKTKMTFRHEGMPKQAGEMAAGGWGQSFDKMAQIVETK